MNWENKQSIHHANANADFLEENIIQTNGGIMINANVSVEKVIYVTNIIFVFLLHVVMNIENI